MRDSTLPLPALLLEKMAETPQNPRYHAEGSVLAHTELVLEKYHEMVDRFDLSQEDREVLYWAAVIHDVGKTLTTRFEFGRWRSPGHEEAGLPLARNFLLGQSEISDSQRRKILDLVRWHGFPLRWVQGDRDITQLKRLGTQTDLRLLGIFSLFDFNGRICVDSEEVVGQISEFHHHFVPLAEYELGAFAQLDETYRTWNLRHKNAVWNALRINNINLLERLFDAESYPDYPNLGKKVFMTLGPPMSGKTTYLQDHLGDKFRVDLSEFGLTRDQLKDEYHLARKLVEFRHSLVIFLNRYRHVVLDGDNLDEGIRQRINADIRNMEIELEYMVFESSLDEILQRNQQQDQPVPEEELRSSYARFGVVHPWEAHQTQFVRV